MENNLNDQEKQLIEQLNIVKQAFIKNTQDLKFSIRRDIVAAELRDILTNNPSQYELKSAIESYITSLLDIKNLRDVNEGK